MKQKLLNFLLITLAMFFLCLVLPTTKVLAYKNISPLEVKELIDSSSLALIIDVRTPEEFATGHLPKSINVPLANLKKDLKRKHIAHSIPIILYCENGKLSIEGAKLLDEEGFTSVYSLGGIDNWPYETQK